MTMKLIIHYGNKIIEAKFNKIQVQIWSALLSILSDDEALRKYKLTIALDEYIKQPKLDYISK